MTDETHNEHIELIGKGLRLIVSDRFTFGTDALLLASFSAPRPRDAALDLGTGCGVIPFVWLREGTERVAAVELQREACEQMERSVALNGLSDRLTVLQADIRALKGRLPANRFDLITMNPPYTPAGKGLLSGTDSDRIARHETALTLEELFVSAAPLLKFGGRMCVCLRPERLTECLCAMREAKIEPKRLRFVAQREGKAPWLFLLEGKRCAKPFLQMEPAFLMYENGELTPEAASLYTNGQS